MRRLGVCGLFVILGSVLGQANPGAGDPAPLRVARVKGASDEMRRLIREVDQRSPTVRGLVDEIGRSNAIVVIEFGYCKGGFRSCVSYVQGDHRQRHIRVMVSTHTTNDRLLATIAHELQHVVEIVRDPEVTDGARTLALYRRIGNSRCRDGFTDACETDAAMTIEAAVLDELHRERGIAKLRN